MRNRLVLATAALGAVIVAVPALAAPAAPVLDGKKTTKLSMTANGGVQDNDADNADILAGADRADCAPPRCAKLVFTYKPAKGVKGDSLFTVSWSNPVSDIDLYVAEVAKDGSTSEVGGHCGGAGGVSEKVFVPAGTLKPGKKYALVADFYRSLNETITGTVEMPASDYSHPVPSNVDGAVYPINCEF